MMEIRKIINLILLCLSFSFSHIVCAQRTDNVPIDQIIGDEKPISSEEIPHPYSDYSVGGIKGEFNVGEMGNAFYVLPISLPNGGGFEPQLSVTYNSSNSTYGLFGYGVDLSGLSVITRAGSDMFNDNRISGIHYNETDNYLLDGKRLVLESGLRGTDGAVYTVQGNPFIKVTIHGNSSSMWFEVRTQEGVVYQYGNSSSSCQSYSNSKGNRIASWYINKAKDRYGNSITYNYTYSNLRVYPKSIVYGENINKDRGIKNEIIFEYENLGSNTQWFVVDDTKGKLDRVVASITSFSNGIQYRKYKFTYEHNGDRRKKTYLENICVQNEERSEFKPIEFHWDYSSVSENKNNIIDNVVVSSDSYTLINQDSKSFTSFDLNGDGVSDIVQLSYVENKYSNGNRNGDGLYAFVINSHVDKSTGKISFESSIHKKWFIDNNVNLSAFEHENTGMTICDLDGDGLNDMLFQYHEKNGSDENGKNAQRTYIKYYWLLGRNLKDGGGQCIHFKYNLQSPNTEEPLFFTFDANGDGKDEILYIEDASCSDGKYYGKILSNLVVGEEVCQNIYKFTFDSKPKKIFNGDYNNDGLLDFIVLCENGYKIYYNQGGNSLSNIFSDTNTNSYKKGNSIKDYWRVAQGDFNGDGQLDFVYFDNSKSWQLSVVNNNGDGTFSAPTITTGLKVVDKTDSDKDDNQFSLYAVDFDGDGLSDVMTCSADYEYHGGIGSHYYTYRSSKIHWLYSDGTSLQLYKSFSTTTKSPETLTGWDKMKEDLKPSECGPALTQGRIFLGDFDGDGMLEIANYGTSLCSNDPTFKEGQINVYKQSSGLASAGKIVRIDEGIDDVININYSRATTSNVYRQSEKKETERVKVETIDENGNKAVTYKDDESELSKYPINTYTLPLSLVSKVTVSNGCKAGQVIKYYYENLNCHVAGRGFLGFLSVTNENVNSGEVSRLKTLEWNNTLWIPKKTEMSKKLEEKTSCSISNFSVSTIGNNYFTYVSRLELSDYDNNETVTTTDYNLEYGVVSNTLTKYGTEDMYKNVSYKYEDSRHPILPTTVTLTQKHSDDSKPFTSVTKYTYDSTGNVISQVSNFGKELALTTTNTYDVYGNVLSSVNTGKGVISVTKYNVYDGSGRNVIKSYQNPSAAVNTFVYDDFCRLIEQKDETDASSILSTSYSYDGWGRLITETSPDGIIKESTYAWGDYGDSRKLYYVLKKEWKPSGNYIRKVIDGQPVRLCDSIYTSSWVKTWYDAVGNETQQESVALDKKPIIKSTYYNDLGQVSMVNSVIGDLSTSEYYFYDKYGKLILDSLSSGKTVRYEYGKDGNNFNTVTSYEDGKVQSKAYDAWGNLMWVNDALGCQVDYFYKSNSKPSEIWNLTSFVEITYDDAGNQISLTDPDAGIMTYSYAADGTILKQTDGRGIQTSNVYDKLGRIESTRIGSTTISNEYGTAGNQKLRLIKRTIGGNSVAFDYDSYGRVISEIKTISGKDTLCYFYEYNNYGQLSKTTYPGGLEVSYVYDKYGNNIKTIADGKVVSRNEKYTGKETVSLYCGGITSSVILDDNGYECAGTLRKDSKVVDYLNVKFDPLTGNLMWRKRYNGKHEIFDYDELDRLVCIKEKSTSGVETVRMSMGYSYDGNILSKSDIGLYEYNNNSKPHAVISVDDVNGIISDCSQSIVYNSFGKVQSILDDYALNRLDVDYGPDMQRCYSTESKNGKTIKSVIYGGDYEKSTENGVTREFYYLNDDVIIVKKDGKFTPYIVFKDNLGSYLAIVDTLGSKVFYAQYDAWGKQTISINQIGFHRGYTGHEMLNEFQLINMNGRLYSPELGRFVNPDNYVQAPDNTQNFNRYSYCLNNPLKYNDPSGELFGLDDVFVIAATFAMNYVSTSLANDDWGWSSLGQAALSTACDYFMYGGSAPFAYVGKCAVNTVVQHVMPSFSISVSDNLNLTISPYLLWGNKGLYGGINASGTLKNGDWSFSLGGGRYNKFSAASASVQYKDFSIGHYLTYYDATTYNGNAIGAQKVGTYSLSIDKFSMAVSNDNHFFSHTSFVDTDNKTHDYDRWRSSAVELSYGKFAIGTYVLNNDGYRDSNGVYRGKNFENSSWTNGQTYIAPLYLGYNSGGISHRIGYSGRFVQKYTQNYVHKYIVGCPRFEGYDHFYEGVFSQKCLSNSNLWGF